MRKEYDFDQGRNNPYGSRVKKQITIRLEEGTIEYFKDLSEELGVPYQTLINLYLRECAASGKRLVIDWQEKD